MIQEKDFRFQHEKNESIVTERKEIERLVMFIVFATTSHRFFLLDSVKLFPSCKVQLKKECISLRSERLTASCVVIDKNVSSQVVFRAKIIHLLTYAGNKSFAPVRTLFLRP